MKRVLAIAGGVIVVYWLGSFVVYLFASDETRIHWVLQECANGFNNTRKSHCLSALAEDYRDETGFNREQLGILLVKIFLTEKHPETHEFRYRVELPSDEVEIEVQEGSPKTANVSFLARFSKRRKHEFKPVWDVKIEGELEKTSAGWKIKRSRHRGIKGQSPF